MKSHWSSGGVNTRTSEHNSSVCNTLTCFIAVISLWLSSVEVQFHKKIGDTNARFVFPNRETNLKVAHGRSLASEHSRFIPFWSNFRSAVLVSDGQSRPRCPELDN